MLIFNPHLPFMLHKTTHLLHISDTVGMALHQSTVQHSFRGVSSFQLNTEYQWFMIHNNRYWHFICITNTTLLTLQALKCICTSYALLIFHARNPTLTYYAHDLSWRRPNFLWHIDTNSIHAYYMNYDTMIAIIAHNIVASPVCPTTL